MPAYKPVTHVIFDMDGLLLDTERLYTVAISELTEEYGKAYPWELKVQCMGMKGDASAKLIIDSLELPLTVPEYLEKIDLKYKELFPQAVLLPGAERLVRHLHKHGVPIAIASGSSQTSFDLKTTSHRELMKLFNPVVLSSSDPEVKAGKPAPDVFLVCAGRFPDKPHSSKCLVFEDAPLGVKAAAAAGMQCVMVPDPRTDKSLTEEATLVLESLEDFKPELFGLPPFNS
ncbi:pseudouridine-5'-phosphatase isoform X1 [Hyalella azteca]|uniref:pseudouridine 5'-phosphatase n=1 Tax=Hyalella azteca TaxID=294128 RepID=A0A8B7P5N1_HYAAZ|nr:pseudouridine-5'-phosphatase isoform X1 [Hyalella azteca]